MTTCYCCPKTADKPTDWLICWRMAHTQCTCVRPWDETVAQIPERYSFCGMDCAGKWMNRSVEESRQETQSFQLTPPKPKQSQTSFNPESFTISDSDVPLTNADLGVKG